MKKALYIIMILMLAVACTKEQILPAEEPVETEKAEVVDTPEEILLAVEGLYKVDRMTEDTKGYTIEFEDPSPVSLKKEYPEGIKKVILQKADVSSLEDGEQSIGITFKDGKSVELGYSTFLSVVFDNERISFDEIGTPVSLSFEVKACLPDSVGIEVLGCENFFFAESQYSKQSRKGTVTFFLRSDSYFESKVKVSVSNGRKVCSSEVVLVRADFKFADGSVEKSFSFPEYERLFEIEMHCADKEVGVVIPEESASWLKAKVVNANVDDKDKTIIYVLVGENNEDGDRSARITVTKNGYDRELHVTVSQIGSGMEGSLKKGLESFYTALHGDSWLRHDNWCSDKPLFEWYGISASNITSKSLFGDQGFTYLGTDDVWILDLAANNMRGTVPDAFWNICKYFESIRISSEYLPDSTVPDCVWHENLWKLDLSMSFMNIPMSSAIGNAKKLQHLNLQLCKVTGGIPEEITSLPAIKDINMRECSLTGSLPQNLGNLKTLESLYLDHNMELGGRLPESFYGMENLKDFDISATKIGGTLTADITKLGRLEYFYIDGCEFEGTIPEEFGTLENLCAYEFHGNYFDAIPQFIRFHGFNSKAYRQWVGSAGFPLGVPYFQRKKSDGRPQNYVVTVPEAFELSEISVDGKPLKRPGYYVDYTKCRQLTFPIWAHIRYDLQTWERSCSLTMKSPQYPYADDLQYPANEYYYDGKDWRHPKLEYPAREYLKVSDEWVHDPTCPWDKEYKVE